MMLVKSNLLNADSREISSQENGFALVGSLLLIAVLLGILASYFKISLIEGLSVRSTKDAVGGLYTAEAAANVRAQELRTVFRTFNSPTGSAPSTSNPCESGDTGSGHYGCQSIALGLSSAETYVVPSSANTSTVIVPPGEVFQGTYALQDTYTIHSKSTKINSGSNNGNLSVEVVHRLIPLFQFAVFYDSNLAITYGRGVDLDGPVHANGNLYLNSTQGVIDIEGQVTATGDIYRGYLKAHDDRCTPNSVEIWDPVAARQLAPGCAARTHITNSIVDDWNGMIVSGVEELTLPPSSHFGPIPGEIYWDSADLRLVLKLNSSNNPSYTNSPTAIEVHNADGSINAAKTALINDAGTCPGNQSGRVIRTNNSMYDNREGKYIRMLNVDTIGLMDCLHTTNFLGDGKALDEDSDGGLVMYFTVDGPNSASSASGYGVRFNNAWKLRSSIAGSPKPKGLTIISDQAVYTIGHWNRVAYHKIPSAIIGDTFNVLSHNWGDSNSTAARWAFRKPADTTIQTAVVAGQSVNENGGQEGLIRLHEDWRFPDRTLTYVGSFVSLGIAKHSAHDYHYGSPVFREAIRDTFFDTDFRQSENLPPLTPRALYLSQRSFEFN